LWPIIGAAYGSNTIGTLNVALSTGLVLFVSITAAGIVVYYLSQWYNKRHGIDVSLLFKTVPPE
jgi:hypothetical protein